jgi:hypothetical protein
MSGGRRFNKRRRRRFFHYLLWRLPHLLSDVSYFLEALSSVENYITFCGGFFT